MILPGDDGLTFAFQITLLIITPPVAKRPAALLFGYKQAQAQPYVCM